MITKKLITKQMHILLTVILFSILILFSGCTKKKVSDTSLVVCSPHPAELISVLVRNFENETGIDVRVISQGTGEIIDNLKKNEASQDSYCDVMWGGSLSSVAPFVGLFEEYISQNEASFEAVYRNDEGCLTRFSDIPSVLMINRNLLGDVQVTGYTDLLNPALKGKIAFADPRKSSSSWEHLLNMVIAMSSGGKDLNAGWSYVEAFCENLGGTLLSGSKSVYEGVSSGEYAVGLTFEEGGANFAENDDNIELVYMKEGVVFTPDGIYIVKGTDHRKEAEIFIDYLTDKNVQTYISQVLNRRSVRSDVQVKESLKSKSEINVLPLDYEYASEMKESWLNHFDECYNR